MLLLSLVLLIINGAFTLLNYLNLQQQFEDSRQAFRVQHEQLLQGLLKQSTSRLQQLGSLIPDLPLMKESLESSRSDFVRDAFESHWSSMQLDMGLDGVRFYSESGELLANWDNFEDSPVAERLRSEYVKQAHIKEKPVSYIDCLNGCIQNMVIPVLDKGKYVGALFVSASLADVILAFKQISGSDVGLLVPYGQEKSLTSAYRALPALKSSVVALSGAENNLPILDLLPSQGEADQHQIIVNQLSLKDFNFEIARVPLHVANYPGQANFAMIFDITESMAKIRNANWKGFLAGLLGLLLSEILLLAFLWLPMTRLRRTAQTIPMLGQGEFEQVRSSIRQHVRKSGHIDEIDLLDETAVALADRLESLNGEVAQRADALAKLVGELSKEKDFVTGLLDTAQAIIITQNRRGRIMMANGFAQKIFGYTHSEIIGIDFAEHFSNDMEVEKRRIEFAQLISQEDGHLSHESHILARDGKLRSIVWSHSRLYSMNPDDPVVLSVGLDITELRQAEKQVSFLADFDSLTGLMNRRRFDEELRIILDSVSADGTSGALLSFDVDEFKYVNDTGGHDVGDALLKAVATELQTLTPKPALTGRMGGDDFVVAFSQMDAAGAIQMARKINLQLGKIELPGVWKSHKITVCIGIVMFPQYGKTPQEVFTYADLAMFQAKGKGRGNWHLYTPDTQLMERITKRVHWAENIEKALAEDRFELFFQPIMSIAEKTVSHYETLIRIRKRDGTLSMPGDFIGVAEETGLIRSIDHMVLSKAIRKLSELEKQNNTVMLSINLSGRSFEDPILVDLLKRELERYQVNPENLIFEITETAAVEDFEAARALMHSIKELGCTFALDDFGIGFSSFHYVKQLPVDYVKIDGSFIRNLTQNPDDQVFVKVLVEAARGFGKKTVAEFVENAEILALLKGYGVDYAQGYYIGKPDKEISFTAVFE